MNDCVCETIIVLLTGLIETTTVGLRVIVVVADFVGSDTLVAVTVTVCCVLIADGAV